MKILSVLENAKLTVVTLKLLKNVIPPLNHPSRLPAFPVSVMDGIVGIFCIKGLYFPPVVGTWRPLNVLE